MTRIFVRNNVQTTRRGERHMMILTPSEKHRVLLVTRFF